MSIRTVHLSDGSPLDATFEVEMRDADLTVVIGSRGGTRGASDARNLDYGRGFELVLDRLRVRGATITDAIVDSGATQHLEMAERRLHVEGQPYPITIDDATDLQRRIGAAQARVGREPGAKGSGNRTKRVRLFLSFAGTPPALPTLENELAGGDGTPETGTPEIGPSQVPRDARLVSTRTNHDIGRPYANVGMLPRPERREPFEVDPDKVDRGNQAHANIQDQLASFLRESGVEPRSPTSEEPEFDLAWHGADAIYVAEVKSTTAANEEKQLRLGLGQVLRYRQALLAAGRLVVAVLVPERKPADENWMTLCGELGVVLVWPGAFNALMDVRGR